LKSQRAKEARSQKPEAAVAGGLRKRKMKMMRKTSRAPAERVLSSFFYWLLASGYSAGGRRMPM
jgi:hypothetical protein